MHLLESEPLCNHTTFRIGGPASYYAVPENVEQIREGIAFAKENKIPFVIIGRGSNILFPDEGYPGMVIEIGKGMEQIQVIDGKRIRAQAGISLAALASLAAKNCLSGLEFAGGIPGTLGGAVTMNAGAYGGEIKDCIVNATVLNEKGELLILNREQLELGYRSSVIQKETYIVLEAEFELQPAKEEDVFSYMRELNAKRREKQPLEFASAGSTFKRPEGYFAGKLIEDAGLRGYRVGDAQVSEKHCGFVINRGKATCADVLQLIEDVQNRVNEAYGVMLEPEVKVIRP